MDQTMNGSVEGAVGSPLNRTCEGCRRRKIKCIPNQTEPDSLSKRCTRCTKLDIACTFNAPTIKRRRRRNETRIRELEQKLDQVLQSVSKGHKADLYTPSTSQASTSTTPASVNEALSAPTTSAETFPGHLVSYETVNGLIAGDDPVVRGIVGESLADELCTKFCTKLLPQYPLVLPQVPLSWRALQECRPALSRAMLAAASSSFRPDIWKSLFQDAERYIVEKAMILGQKSLDLVQGALVLAIWTHPPDKFQDLNFGQLASIAATMVIDLRSANDKSYCIQSDNAKVQAKDYLELARTYSACYFLCSSIALSYRRPSTFQYGSWVRDCADILDSPSIAHIGDRRLAAWTRLQRLAEESLTIAGLGESLSIKFSDPRTRLILKNGIERVKNWRQNLPEDIMHETLDIHYHMILLNFYEPGLHDAHEKQDFRPPYVIHTLPSAEAFTLQSPQSVNARMECLDIARGLLSLFLQFSPEGLQQIPVIVFTRMMYAVVVIIKLEVFNQNSPGTASTATGEPTPTLNIIRRIVGKLALAADGPRFRVPATFHAVLQRLLTRFCENHPGLHTEENEIIEPLMDLKINETKPEASLDPPLVHTVQLSAEHQVFDAGPALQHMGIDPLSDPSITFNDYFRGASDDATAMMFWNSFLGPGNSPMTSEQCYDTNIMNTL